MLISVPVNTLSLSLSDSIISLDELSGRFPSSLLLQSHPPYISQQLPLHFGCWLKQCIDVS